MHPEGEEVKSHGICDGCYECESYPPEPTGATLAAETAPPVPEDTPEVDEARVRRYGRTIWETSRADESTISATGADIVARAVIAVDCEEHDELRAELADARERLRQAEERLDKVKAMHRLASDGQHCFTCVMPWHWPCPTASELQ